MLFFLEPLSVLKLTQVCQCTGFTFTWLQPDIESDFLISGSGALGSSKQVLVSGDVRTMLQVVHWSSTVHINVKLRGKGKGGKSKDDSGASLSPTRDLLHGFCILKMASREGEVQERQRGKARGPVFSFFAQAFSILRNCLNRQVSDYTQTTASNSMPGGVLILDCWWSVVPRWLIWVATRDATEVHWQVGRRPVRGALVTAWFSCYFGTVANPVVKRIRFTIWGIYNPKKLESVIGFTTSQCFVSIFYSSSDSSRKRLSRWHLSILGWRRWPHPATRASRIG